MTASRTVRFLCLLGVTILALLRLVQLSADPPLNITTSGVLYTDEGQYSRNAVHWVLTGQWYTPGDFNPAIIYPVATAIQMLAFRLLGLSTASARAVTVLFSWLTLLLTYRICRYYVSTTSSLVAVLLLAASYRFFAFSRLALLDIPMIAFALSSLALAIGSARRRSSAGMALSATAFMCCWLTKFGVYLFPVIVYAILIESRARRHATVQVAAWLGVSLALFATYYLLLVSPYYDDYRYVMQAVFGRVRPGVLEAVRNSVAAVYHALLADPVLATAVLGSVALLLFSNPSFRASPLLRIAALWTLCRILSLGTTSYQPPRYFLPIHVPLAMATACIVQYVRWPQDGWTGRPFFALLVLVALVLNTHAIVSYMTDPRVTFSAMCADIEQRVVARPGQPGPVLMGNLADSISLATGIPAVNDRLGTADLATRVRLYAPTHYVSLGPVEPATEQVLRQTGDLSLLSKYNVYGNYYTGEPVYLYGLDRRW
jgi:4-amino-4-deoxy-L-arabinose transferase-like glycosyltransferase